MDVRPIRTEEDHQAALNEIEACWGAAEDTEEGDRLGVLLALVEAYEEKHWRFCPIDVLNYAIEELEHTQAEHAKLSGSLARIRDFIAPAGANGRHDRQDQQSLEDLGRSARPSLPDSSSRLSAQSAHSQDPNG